MTWVAEGILSKDQAWQNWKPRLNFKLSFFLHVYNSYYEIWNDYYKVLTCWKSYFTIQVFSSERFWDICIWERTSNTWRMVARTSTHKVQGKKKQQFTYAACGSFVWNVTNLQRMKSTFHLKGLSAQSAKKNCLLFLRFSSTVRDNNRN